MDLNERHIDEIRIDYDQLYLMPSGQNLHSQRGFTPGKQLIITLFLKTFAICAIKEKYILNRNWMKINELNHADHTVTNDIFQDETSSKTNTLFDDADDIQRQLDNEARDRIKLGKIIENFPQPKTIWVFNFPTHFPANHFITNTVYSLERPARDTQYRSTRQDEYFSTSQINLSYKPDWDYALQHKWYSTYPDCGGRSQSPVNLPISGLIKARGARPILFQNFELMPRAMTLMNDGKRVMLFGEWPLDKRPLIYGGAAHSRRYLFHALTVHWPSEHTVGGLQYPIESQALYISAEYRDLEHALEAATGDPQAFLGIASLYKYGNRTHKGLEDILDTAKTIGYRNSSIEPKPISYFSPPFKEYACYQGSLTAPPCTESVLWLVRGRTLSITRISACVLPAKKDLLDIAPKFQGVTLQNFKNIGLVDVKMSGRAKKYVTVAVDPQNHLSLMDWSVNMLKF